LRETIPRERGVAKYADRFEKSLTIFGCGSDYQPKEKYEPFDSGLLSVPCVAFLVRLDRNRGQGSACCGEIKKLVRPGAEYALIGAIILGIGARGNGAITARKLAGITFGRAGGAPRWTPEETKAHLVILQKEGQSPPPTIAAGIKVRICVCFGGVSVSGSRAP